MSLDAKLTRQVERLLRVVDDHGTEGSRLIDDAKRLWRRVQNFVRMGLVAPESDMEALELSCYALQLPMRQSKALPVGKLARTNLRDRAEQSAELLCSLMADDVEESLLDRATRMLHEMPQRSPMLDEAKLLADAVNLDDFGAGGLVQQMAQLTRQGEGIVQLLEGCAAREKYGYWEARLKDGFHFGPVREMARRRVENARQICKLLEVETREDESA